MTSNSSISSSERQLPLVARSALWVVGLLIAFEIIGRVFFADSVSGRFDYGYHPTAGFVEQSDQLRLVRAGGRRFRPQVMPLPKPPGRVRIFVIGDSVPRGSSLEKAYSGQLEALLRAQHIDARVYNMGIPGFGVRRTQLVLKQALHYQPDLVVLHVNDSNEFEDEREWRRAQQFKGWQPWNWAMKSVVFRRLYELKLEKLYWRKLPAEVRNKAAVLDADAEIRASMDQATRDRWRHRLDETLSDSVAMVVQAKVPLVLLTQSVYIPPQGHMHKPHVEQLVEQLAQSSSTVIAASMYPFVDDAPARYFADGAHLTPLGHRQLARGLLPLVTASLAR